MKLFQNTILMAALLGLVACNQSSLLPTGSFSGEIGALSLSAVHHLGDGTALAAEEEGAKTFVNDRGLRITLTHASVGYRSLALLSSGDDPECVGGNDVTLAINGSDDLLVEDLVETSLGSHTIPLAAFCSYELTFGPSEEAAALKFHAGEDHGEELDTVHGAHATLHLEGTWSPDGGAETAFAIETEDTVAVQSLFGSTTDGVFSAHPLHFHEGETTTSKIFGVKYDSLFNAVDFGTMDEAAVLEKILENLKTSVALYRKPAAH